MQRQMQMADSATLQNHTHFTFREEMQNDFFMMVTVKPMVQGLPQVWLSCPGSL